ncbi:hypothetical protein FACS189492_1730 [Clostridia bacterium]|nr:hypothetical protein FACS189492_1730 [Clostridia bacterium]
MNKRIAIICMAAALAVSASACGQKPSAPTGAAPGEQGQKTNYITASGILEAEEQYTVAAKVAADIVSADFSEGDRVNAGDVLYVLEQKDIQSNLQKARLAVERAQLAYSQNADNIKKLTVRAPIGGVIKGLYISKD